MNRVFTLCLALVVMVSFSSCEIFRQVVNESIEQSNSCIPATSSEYADIMNAIASRTFEDDKLSTAKQRTKGNCLSTQQIKGIARQFKFEDSKVEYTKMAYPYCSDPKNYRQLYDIFKFDDSIDELEEVIL